SSCGRSYTMSASSVHPQCLYSSWGTHLKGRVCPLCKLLYSTLELRDLSTFILCYFTFIHVHINFIVIQYLWSYELLNLFILDPFCSLFIYDRFKIFYRVAFIHSGFDYSSV